MVKAVRSPARIGHGSGTPDREYLPDGWPDEPAIVGFYSLPLGGLKVTLGDFFGSDTG